MISFQIELLDPNAKALLEELAKLKLIKIKKIENHKKQFNQLMQKLRSKDTDGLDFEAITKEVEMVRAKRYKNEG